MRMSGFKVHLCKQFIGGHPRSRPIRSNQSPKVAKINTRLEFAYRRHNIYHFPISIFNFSFTHSKQNKHLFCSYALQLSCPVCTTPTTTVEQQISGQLFPLPPVIATSPRAPLSLFTPQPCCLFLLHHSLLPRPLIPIPASPLTKPQCSKTSQNNNQRHRRTTELWKDSRKLPSINRKKHSGDHQKSISFLPVFHHCLKLFP